jgi:hypothetical protein
MDILQNNKPGAKVQSRLTMAYWSNRFLLLYILTMPFVSAFAFTGTLSVPLFFAVFLFTLMCVQIAGSEKLPAGFVGVDLVLIFLFLFLAVFAFVINGLGNSRALNHTVAYISTFLLFYVAIKFTLFVIIDKNKLFKRILQCITFITIASAFFANMEFISGNFLNFDFNEYIPRPLEGEKFYNPIVVGLFVRARGFATESGHFTFMMELFSPLTLYYMYFSGYCKWHPVPKAFTIIFIFFSFVFAASSASFVIIPLAVLLAALIHIKKIFFYFKKHTIKFFIASVVTVSIFIVFNYFLSLYAFILLSVTDKLDSGSLDDRQERIDFFFDKFSHFDSVKKIGGAGPAGFDILGFDDSKSILSLYYSITFELGFLGLLVTTLLFLYFIFHTLKIRTKIGFFLLVSVISGVMHYYFIANFWYPWFWFIAALAIFCNKRFSDG